jgi:hypothetical protein
MGKPEMGNTQLDDSTNWSNPKTRGQKYGKNRITETQKKEKSRWARITEEESFIFSFKNDAM